MPMCVTTEAHVSMTLASAHPTHLECTVNMSRVSAHAISKDAGICTTCPISPFTIILYDRCEWVVYTPPILVQL